VDSETGEFGVFRSLSAVVGFESNGFDGSFLTAVILL
jgi:hypothetical protein